MSALPFEYSEHMPPQYNLSREERRYAEASLVGAVEAHYPQQGIYAAIISSDHVYANLVRSYEAEFFPEVVDTPSDEEKEALFMALVDTRSESRRIVHATTISGFNSTDMHEVTENSSTGFTFIDDLVDLGNFTPEEFTEYYEQKGVNVASCIAVETNFRVGERAPALNGIDTVSLAYLKILGVLLQNTPQPQCGESGVFASINRASLASFGRVGLRHELLMDRDDLITPEEDLGQEYTPVFIPYDNDSRHLFEAMELQLPEVHFR